MNTIWWNTELISYNPFEANKSFLKDALQKYTSEIRGLKNDINTTLEHNNNMSFPYCVRHTQEIGTLFEAAA